MSKFIRRQFFEALCQLRARYEAKGAADSQPVISVGDAIAYAEGLLAEAGQLGGALNEVSGADSE